MNEHMPQIPRPAVIISALAAVGLFTLAACAEQTEPEVTQ